MSHLKTFTFVALFVLMGCKGPQVIKNANNESSSSTSGGTTGGTSGGTTGGTSGGTSGGTTGSGQLLQSTNIVYQGSFKLPSGLQGSTYGLGYGGAVGVYNPNRNSLIISGHIYEQKLIEVAIPTNISTSTTPTASALTNLIEPLDGKLNSINPTDPNSKHIGAGLVFGNRLLLGAYSYYDGGTTQVKSYFNRPLDLTVSGQTDGPIKLGTSYPGFVDKYACHIPLQWQAALGGPALAGGSGGAINGVQSWGPAAQAFDPATFNGSADVATLPLLGYPIAHPLNTGIVANPLWNQTDFISGAAFPTGSDSILFFGQHGMGAYCYGPGTNDPSLHGQPTTGGTWCYDPSNSSKGTHAYPYRSQVWAYDALDLQKVKNGTLQVWQVQPYAVWELDSNFTNVSGVGYDSATQRLFLTIPFTDGDQPTVRVYKIQ